MSEQSTFLASAAFNAEVPAAVVAIPGWTDDAASVSLVTNPPPFPETFDPSGFTLASGMPSLESDDPPAVLEDGDGRTFYNWPDPVGGWTFTSSGGTYPYTVTGFFVKIASNYLGWAAITPQTISADGQTIILGKVQLQAPVQAFEPPPG